MVLELIERHGLVMGEEYDLGKIKITMDVFCNMTEE